MKTFSGVRIRRLREEQRLTQQALASALGISLSYLNQLENNQRPISMNVALKLDEAFGFDATLLAEGDEARLVSELRSALADPAVGENIATADLRALASNMPAVGRALVSLQRRYQRALEQSAALSSRLGGDQRDAITAASTPFEEVRDFFYTRHNYVAELDEAAETAAADMHWRPGEAATALAERLERDHDVRVVTAPRDDASADTRRQFDRASRTLHLSPHLGQGQQAFQMATQLAFLEQNDAIEALVSKAPFAGEDSRRLARIGLANYFAGALVLPYRAFLEAAEATRYDIGLLGQRFGVGFETACHRLSTMQRPDARGVPFFFIRVDRAGNISKRQSATDFHFSRVGGACPLWNVYEAFAQPGRILVQVARMPDDRAYLWIARSVSRGRGGYHAPRKTFAVALGCDIQHAGRLVYSDGVDLRNPAAATPIGAGCRVCDRPACPQRAFPPVGRPLNVDDTRSAFAPYGVS
ncbi:MAG: Cro/Cl family transcriptional regulator [Hyphomonas sp. 34-62-18]|nr:short-chain fatty acyl-CoA regulator family protein [Hyphomonas sp. 34-62-18]OZB19120.1 MAG: Cro/Cl family transcriptional regulator [Hyphomonas sp. 34-62-18]